MQPRRPNSSWWFGLVATVAVALVSYAATMPHTVTLEDSGSFLMSAYFGGVAHPPGYPVYTALGYLAAHGIPFGSVALRVHLLSACCAAVASGAVFAIARRLGMLNPIAIATGLLFALAPAVWSQAIVAEVYALNALFCFGLIALGLRYRETGGRASAALLALLFGVSLGNHWPLMLLVSPGLLVSVWPRRAELLRLWPRCVPLLLFGLVPYLLLYWRSQSDPMISFSGPIDDLIAFVARSDYAAVESSPSAGLLDKLEYLWFFARESAAQLSWLGGPLALAGAVLVWRTSNGITRGIAAALLLTWAGTSVVLFMLLNMDYGFAFEAVYRTYPLPAYGVTAIWAGIAMSAIHERLQRGWITSLLLPSLAVALVAWNGWQRNDCRSLTYAEDYATAILSTVAPDAVVFTGGDTDIGPLGYVHHVLGVRPDVELYNVGGYVFGNRLAPTRADAATKRAAIQRFLAGNQRPVYYVSRFPEHDHGTRDFGLYQQIAVGRRGQQVANHKQLRAFVLAAMAIDDRGDQGLIAHRATQVRRYGSLLARVAPLERDADKRAAIERDLASLGATFFGKLGAIEGAIFGADPSTLARWIEEAATLADREPAVSKRERARVHELRGLLHLRQNDRRAARAELLRALEIWPHPGNTAQQALAKLR